MLHKHACGAYLSRGRRFSREAIFHDQQLRPHLSVTPPAPPSPTSPPRPPQTKTKKKGTSPPAPPPTPRRVKNVPPVGGCVTSWVPYKTTTRRLSGISKASTWVAELLPAPPASFGACGERWGTRTPKTQAKVKEKKCDAFNRTRHQHSNQM